MAHFLVRPKSEVEDHIAFGQAVSERLGITKIEASYGIRNGFVVGAQWLGLLVADLNEAYIQCHLPDVFSAVVNKTVVMKPKLSTQIHDVAFRVNIDAAYGNRNWLTIERFENV